MQDVSECVSRPCRQCPEGASKCLASELKMQCPVLYIDQLEAFGFGFWLLGVASKPGRLAIQGQTHEREQSVTQEALLHLKHMLSKQSFERRQQHLPSIHLTKFVFLSSISTHAKRLMDKILHDPKDPKLWELWYIPYYGSCRILSIEGGGRQAAASSSRHQHTAAGRPTRNFVVRADCIRMSKISVKTSYRNPRQFL